MPKLQPVGHRVLVKLKEFTEKEEKSESGIILKIHDNMMREQKAMRIATVISLGPTAYKDFGDGTPWCQPGDSVSIVRYSGEDFENPNTREVYRIINDEDVLGIVEEEDK